MVSNIDGTVKPAVQGLWRRFYPEYRLDKFEELVRAHVGPESRILEIGAGSGRGTQHHFHLKGEVAHYMGIDLDPRVMSNPHLDDALVANAERLPFSNGSFDIVFHTMVAEHIREPRLALMETSRVLRKGGYLLFQTPSRYYYPMLVAAITPHWFHELYIYRFGSGAQAQDVFPTIYKLNDRRAVEAAARPAALKPEIEFWSTPPGYLRANPLLFLLGILYERSLERLIPPMRAHMVVVAQKL
jgi:SAM-dependent methyltransferase